jgi:hypothetical protein
MQKVLVNAAWIQCGVSEHAQNFHVITIAEDGIQYGI